MSEEQVTQYRIPMKVRSVSRDRNIVGGYKNERGEKEFVYGPWLWYVHFYDSFEALCFGEDRPNLFDGEEVDVIIRKRG